LFQQILDALNSSELKKKICWKLDTTAILEDVSKLKNNICVVGPDYITLVIADNKNHGNGSSFIGIRRAIKLGGSKAKTATK